MQWNAGVGTLPDSNLKFKADESGGLAIIVTDEGTDSSQTGGDVNNQQTNGTTNPTEVPADEPKPDPDRRTCVQCGKIGLLQNFIRAGKFCATSCAMSHANQIKSLVKSHETTVSPESNGRKQGSKQELRGRQLGIPMGRGAPVADKRKLHSSDDLIRSKVLKSGDGENDENNRSNSQHVRQDSLIAGKGRGGGRFGRKNRVKELRMEETNSLNDSEKLSLPSSPSSSLVLITPQSALHQSIFSMRALQHQQEPPPLQWERHSQNLHPVLTGVRLPEVLRWDPEKVADFVNTIPGCRDIGQVFADELIDGQAFLLLNQQDIVKNLSIKLGPAVKIYNAVVLIRDAIEI